MFKIEILIFTKHTVGIDLRLVNPTIFTFLCFHCPVLLSVDLEYLEYLE